MSILSERVKAKRAEMGLSQTDLARIIGVKPQSIQQLEAGGVESPRYLHKLAEALGVTWQWLVGTYPVVNVGESHEAASARVTGVQKNASTQMTADNSSQQKQLLGYGERDLPVYGAALGGDGAVMLNRGDEVDRVHRPPALFGVRDAFGVVVAGDSMEPMFIQGDIAWIHPGRPPMPRRGVLIELRDGHAHLKEFISASDDIVRCKQYNPAQNLTFKRKDVQKLYLVVGSGIYG